ncbi:hypothetical protein AB1Y20_009334 [Prymnesium parvum]|uniref:Protochlorophyllide reductase n=1 Tax=Prymnesium parvum TaxID=97485 RepID=A0AB34K426_PRYPA
MLAALLLLLPALPFAPRTIGATVGATSRTIRWVTRGLAPELLSNLRHCPEDSFMRRAEATGVAIVTGGTGGIGAPLCQRLCRRGFKVVVASRHEERGRALVRRMISEGGQAVFVPLDLSVVSGGAEFAAALGRVGVQQVSLLVNCAGSMGGSCSETFGVNLIGPAALSMALLPLLLATDKPTIVNVGSSSHLRARTVDVRLLHADQGDRRLQAYAQSKLGLMYVSIMLRTIPTLCVRDVHPGIVWTPMLRSQLGSLADVLRRVGLARRLFKSPERGAQMVLMAAVSPHRHEGTPSYWVDGRPAPWLASAESKNASAARNMWDVVVVPELEAAGIPSLAV